MGTNRCSYCPLFRPNGNQYVAAVVIKFRNCVLLLVLCGVCLAKASDQADDTFITANWRNEHGLPHSIINTLVQTQDGYLWLGTYVGLVRFDGVRFVHYTPADIPELGDGRIATLFEDREANLWIAVEGGRLVVLKNGVARVHVPGGALQSHTVVALAQDAEQTIWFQTDVGEFGRVTDAGLEIRVQLGGALLRSGRFLFSDQRGRIWAGTPDGLKMWRDGNLIFPDTLPPALRETVDAASSTRDGSILAYRAGKIWRWNETDSAAVIEVEGETGGVVSLLEDASGGIWVAAFNGVQHYHKSERRWQKLSPQALPGLSRVLYEDREGNLWRGSFGGGLSRIRPRLFTMHNLTEPGNDLYARSATVSTNGELWAIVNSDSVVTFDAKTDTLKKMGGPNAPIGCRTISGDRRGNIWLGVYGGPLLYRWGDGEFLPMQRPNQDAEAVHALYEDSRGNLWLGYAGGAGVGFMPDGDPNQWRDFPGIPHPDVRAIGETADGAMWFGTHYGGVCRWQDGKWTQFRTRDGLPSDYVRCLFVDSQGTLWLGTLRGLCRWRDGQFVAITSRNGLWNDSLSHLAEDDRGNLWMSSFGGVFRVSRAMLNEFADGQRDSIQCVGYGRNDGLSSLECPGSCQPAGAKTPDGRLWIPTVSGLASVSPRAIKENKHLPPVWIEELSIDGITTNVTATSVTIPPGKRRLDFRFTTLSLTAPDRVLFRYKLTGLDDDWSPAQSQRTATYNYLPPGKYTFEVVACNNDGLWNESGHSLQLVIQPFFWQTWWFKIGICGGLALALVLGVRQAERIRARIKLERLEQEHAIEHERSRIAKDIHDDLGANLTQIVLLSRRAESANGNPQETAHWLQKIPATARQTIRSLDEIVWAVNPQHDSLESLANYISQFALEHLALAGIRCQLDVPTVLPAIRLGAEVRHNCVLTVREALQNVVAHAAATEVNVALTMDDARLRITIKDNGQGFDLKRSQPGNGLANMRRRIEELGGHFEISSNPGNGSTVQITLPMSSLSSRIQTKPN